MGDPIISDITGMITACRLILLWTAFRIAGGSSGLVPRKD